MAVRALLEEFQAVSMTLATVTAANNAGHSTLIPSHGDGPYSLCDMLDIDRVQTFRTAVLNSITYLIVRNEEVVTVISIQPQSEATSAGLEPGIVGGDNGNLGRDAESNEGDVEKGGIGHDDENEEEGSLGHGGEGIVSNAQIKELKAALPDSFIVFSNTSQKGSNSTLGIPLNI